MRLRKICIFEAFIYKGPLFESVICLHFNSVVLATTTMSLHQDISVKKLFDRLSLK